MRFFSLPNLHIRKLFRKDKLQQVTLVLKFRIRRTTVPLSKNKDDNKGTWDCNKTVHYKLKIREIYFFKPFNERFWKIYQNDSNGLNIQFALSTLNIWLTMNRNFYHSEKVLTLLNKKKIQNKMRTPSQ